MVNKILNYIKQDICEFVCLYRWISLTAEPVWFSSLLMWLLKGIGKVYSNLGEDTTTLQEKSPLENNYPLEL